MFVRSGTKWSLQHTFTDLVGDFGDGSSSAVAVSGSTIVAPNTPTGVNDGGMATIYARTGSTRSGHRDAYTT